MSERKTLAAIIVLGIAILGVIGAGTYLWAADEIRDRHPGMEDYTLEDQEKAARFIVDGLNTHDPTKVRTIYTYGVPQTEKNIESALPPPDCHYVLDSVKDRGEQGRQEIYGHLYHSTRRFDMVLDQVCPGKAPTRRTIRVLATAQATEWVETALVPE